MKILPHLCFSLDAVRVEVDKSRKDILSFHVHDLAVP